MQDTRPCSDAVKGCNDAVKGEYGPFEHNPLGKYVLAIVNKEILEYSHIFNPDGVALLKKLSRVTYRQKVLNHICNTVPNVCVMNA